MCPYSLMDPLKYWGTTKGQSISRGSTPAFSDSWLEGAGLQRKFDAWRRGWAAKGEKFEEATHEARPRKSFLWEFNCWFLDCCGSTITNTGQNFLPWSKCSLLTEEKWGKVWSSRAIVVAILFESQLHKHRSELIAQWSLDYYPYLFRKKRVGFWFDFHCVFSFSSQNCCHAYLFVL